MADGFKWVFELIDRVSSPAKTLDGRLKELIEHTEGLKKSFNALGSVEAFKIAYEGAEMLVDKLKELGLEALRAADFERSAAINFKALTGSSEMGEGMFKAAKMFAQRAGTDLKSTVSQFAGLRMAGIIDPTNIGKMVAAAYDVQNKSFGRKSADSVLDMFSSIQTRGQLAGRMLMGMDGIISAKALGAQLGFNVNTMKQLQERLDKSPVGAAKGLEAIMKALSGTSKTVGQVTSDIGEGWTGSVNKLSTAWDLLLGDFEKTGAFKAIIGLVNNIADALGPTTESGKAIRNLFLEIAGAVERLIKPLSTPEGMKGFTDSLTSAKNDALQILDTFKAIFKFGGGLSDKLNAIQGLSQGTSSLEDVFSAFGFKKGGGYEEMMRATGERGGAAHMEGVKGPKGLDARSPSKAYERLGRWSIEGFNIGMGTGRMSSPVASLPGIAGGAGGGARPAINFTINASTTEAKALGDRARDIVASALAAAFEEIAVESGVS